jgi:hypothetical protein
MKRLAVRAVTMVAGLSMLFLVGCGGHDDMGSTTMGPNGSHFAMGPSDTGQSTMPALVSVDPPGGATGVPVTTSILFRFGTAMGSGMEDLVDLHMGDLTGPVVPMSCGWSADRTTLTCTPTSPLEPGRLYATHVGGSMTDENGQDVDLTQRGTGMGGWWVMGGMMGGFHAGDPWNGMGSGWRHSNGSYGMVFSFTTA